MSVTCLLYVAHQVCVMSVCDNEEVCEFDTLVARGTSICVMMRKCESDTCSKW